MVMAIALPRREARSVYSLYQPTYYYPPATWQPW
jgi:hypothetical protein